MSASKEDLCCNPQRRPRTSRRNKMGRPLNKRFFGTPTADGNEIKVKFFNTAPEDGWIVKQLGSKKFRCTNGTDIKDCFLVDKAAADLLAGEMSIVVKDDDGDVSRVVKITARKVTLSDGTSTPWNFSDSDADGAVEMEEAGTANDFTGADDFEV